MGDSELETLRRLATAFRGAIELACAERLPGALTYFPEGACRMTSRLLAQHLARRPDSAAFGRPQLLSGVLPGTAPGVRHFWLEVDGAVVDLTADPFGERPVVVGPRTAFHHSLASPIAEDAADVLASLSADDRARLERQLAAIESRLSRLTPPRG
jgi:hypothetical protein